MTLFAKEEFSEAARTALSSVAHQIALGVERDDSDRLREMFIGILGHDLRNPLNAITMGASVLADDVELSPSNARTVKRAQAIGELRDANSERVIDAKYSGNGQGDWDPDRLVQVFSNLVGNALKHGRQNAPVRVDIDATDSVIHCLFRNLGSPIPAALLPTLFDPFRQGRESATHGADGLGLGLFIAQQIVVAHGDIVQFDPTACDRCPLRAKCTSAAPGYGRTVTIAHDEQLQHRLRKLTASPRAAIFGIANDWASSGSMPWPRA